MSAKQAINDKLQGSVATYLRCGGSSSEKKIFSLLRFDRIMVMSLWTHFWAHPVRG